MIEDKNHQLQLLVGVRCMNIGLDTKKSTSMANLLPSASIVPKHTPTRQKSAYQSIGMHISNLFLFVQNQDLNHFRLLVYSIACGTGRMDDESAETIDDDRNNDANEMETEDNESVSSELMSIAGSSSRPNSRMNQSVDSQDEVRAFTYILHTKLFGLKQYFIFNLIVVFWHSHSNTATVENETIFRYDDAS